MLTRSGSSFGVLVGLVLLVGFQTACDDGQRAASPATGRSNEPPATTVPSVATATETGTPSATTEEVWPPSGTLTTREAVSHVGESATVCGTVMRPRYAGSSRGQPTFLNLDRPYPDQAFTIVIWGEDRGAFPEPPEEMYRGADVCATGLIELYEGVPEIRARDPSGIAIR